MGFFIGEAKLYEVRGNKVKASQLKALSLWIPVLLHGFYDFCLSMDSVLLTVAFFIFVITGIIFGLIITKCSWLFLIIKCGFTFIIGLILNYVFTFSPEEKSKIKKLLKEL